MKSCLRITGLALASVLAACGTTSDIQPSPKPEAVAAAPVQKGKPALDLSAYDKVVVLDFVDATDKSKIKPADVRAYSDTLATAAHSFPDLIAQKVRDTGAFQEVVRGESAGKALVISGRITGLAEGNAALRLFIGMGAGSSHFDATTELADAETNAVLGQLTTDKNSWALGGGLAAGQSVQSFMQGAAEKIAKQIADSKRGPATAKAH